MRRYGFLIDDEILKEALLLQMQERVNSYPDSYYQMHKFSNRYLKKMRKLHWRSTLPRTLDYTLLICRHVAVIFLIVFTVLMTTILSVEALRTRFFQFIEQKFKEYSIVFFQPTISTVSLATETWNEYAPSYLPPGLILTSSIQYDGLTSLEYKNLTNNEHLLYEQLLAEDASYGINTENVEIEILSVHGMDAYYCSDLGEQSLIWNDGVYAFFLSGNYDKDTLLKIASSVRPME